MFILLNYSKSRKEAKFIWKQFFIIAINLVFGMEFVCTIIFTSIYVFIKLNADAQVNPVHVVLIMSYYSKISVSLLELGHFMRYNGISRASIQRIQVNTLNLNWIKLT